MPLQASSASCRQMTKPMPGTPSRHLLEEAATASKAISRASTGRAPKALMESMSRRRPARATTAATSAIGIQHAGGGLAMDDGDMGDGGIAGQRLLHRGGIDRPVLGPFEDGMSAAVIVADARHALAIGAVDQDQQLARRPARSCRSWPPPRRCRCPAWARRHGCPVPPASATSFSRTRRLMAMNSWSREPQSWSIACFTVARGGERTGGEEPGVAAGGWVGHGRSGPDSAVLTPLISRPGPS